VDVGAEGSVVSEVPRPSVTPSTWLRRPLMESDESALHYLLGVSYTRTKAGRRAGVDGAGDTAPGRSTSPEAVARQKAFLHALSPVWTWLLDNADVTLLVDPDEPQIIWSWLITSGDVIHAVGVKRSFCERIDGDLPVSVDMVTEMLGDRLERHQVCSLELPQMRSRGSGTIGLDRPREWSLDPTYLLMRMNNR
jgi:hypothetical protein